MRMCTLYPHYIMNAGDMKGCFAVFRRRHRPASTAKSNSNRKNRGGTRRRFPCILLLYNCAQTCYNACIRDRVAPDQRQPAPHRRGWPIFTRNGNAVPGPDSESCTVGVSADRQWSAARPGVKPVYRRLAHVTRKSGLLRAGKQSGTAKFTLRLCVFAGAKRFSFPCRRPRPGQTRPASDCPQSLPLAALTGADTTKKEDTPHGIQALQPGRD